MLARVGAHVDEHEQVARRGAVGARVALAADAQPVLVLDAWRDADRHLPRLPAHAAPAARAARLVDDLAGAAAAGAARALVHRAAGGRDDLVDDAVAAALRALADLGAGRRAAPRARAARLEVLDLLDELAAEEHRLEVDLELAREVVALGRAAAPPLARGAASPAPSP